MGMLDSNKVKNTATVVVANHWTNQTAEVAYSAADNGIDVSEYNSIHLFVTISDSAATLKFAAGYSSANSDTDYHHGIIKALDVTWRRDGIKVVDARTLELAASAQKYEFILDVSQMKNLRIGKLGTGSVTLDYYLTQDTIDHYMIEKYEIGENVSLPMSKKTDTVNDGIGGVVYDIFVDAASSVRIVQYVTDSDSIKQYYTRVERSDGSVFFAFNPTLGPGRYKVSLAVDKNAITFDTQIFYTGSDATKCVCRRFYTKDAPFVEPTNRKELLLLRTSSNVGSNAWVSVPNWAKTAILKTVMPSEEDVALITSRSVPRGSDKPSSELSLLSRGFFNDCVDVLKGSDVYQLSKGNKDTLSVGGAVNMIAANVEDSGWLSYGISNLTLSSGYAELYIIFLSDSFVEFKEKSCSGGFDSLFDKIFVSPEFDMYRWVANYGDGRLNLVAAYDSYVVWTGDGCLFISIYGIFGKAQKVIFNSDNFPNLIEGSTIMMVVCVPWHRGNTPTEGNICRVNVITDKGQIYHNYPSRSASGDGTEQSGDVYRFDESVVWELPDRFTPVKTESGTDATLIATEKYKYMPCFDDEAYELHPAISTDNGYGNGGFPATITHDNVVRGRFWFPKRSSVQANPFYFMGGFAPHEKLTMIGTYRSNNSSTGACRICLFTTNDGGRSWYNIYEFGGVGHLVDSNGVTIPRGVGDGERQSVWLDPIHYIGSASSGEYTVKVRKQIIPTEEDKEPEHKFIYDDAVAVSSITGTSDGITMVLSSDIDSGSIVCFGKVSASSGDFDWAVNSNVDSDSAGNGVFFKVERTSANHYKLHYMPHNPNNNLPVRHIHSVDRCKDGYAVSCGERYPTGGWLIYIPVTEADSFDSKMPWGDFEFIRLNSTDKSLYRALGMQLMPNDDVYIGLDDATVPMGEAEMPEGRTQTFTHNSTGVWKGKLKDVDNPAGNFECILPANQVSYLFKYVQGVMIFSGQQGYFALSLDDGKTWTQVQVPRAVPVITYYKGYTNTKTIVFGGGVAIRVKR